MRSKAVARAVARPHTVEELEDDGSRLVEDDEEEPNDNPEESKPNPPMGHRKRVRRSSESDTDWHRYCRFVNHPSTKVGQEDMVTIQGLNRSIYKHQLIGSMSMKDQECSDCEGGWCADDMGLGKVRIYPCY